MKRMEAIKVVREFLGSRAVVVVDSSSTYRTMVKHMLSDLNIRNMKLVSRAEEAKKVLAETPVGLFIVEWLIEGQNGLQFCRELRQNPLTKDCIFLLVTSENMRSDVMLAAEVGIDGYLLKPFSATDLHHKIIGLMQGILRPSVEEQYLRLGNLALVHEHFEQAGLLFGKAQTRGRSARGLVGLAKVELGLKHTDRAINLAQQALGINPNFLEANRELLKIFEETGDVWSAREQAKILHEASPGNPRYTLSLAQSYLRLGSLSEAESFFKKTIDLSSHLALSYKGLGDVAWQKKDYNSAAKYYEKALDLDKSDVSTLNSLGMSFVQLERYPEAEKSYRLALRLDPNDARIYYNLGQSYERQEMFSEAYQYYYASVKLDSRFEKARRGLNRTRKKRTNFDLELPMAKSA